MPYIGNQPADRFGSLVYQDLTGVTGSPVKRGFTLNQAVANEMELEVFVNNVRQEPTDAYTVSGTTLTMTGDVETTDDFYVVFQGKAIGTVIHPSNSALEATTGTFSGALSATTGTFTGDVTTTGDFKPTGKEYFQVFLTTQQNGQSDNTANVVDFGSKGTVIYDTKSNFDSSNDAYELDSADGVYLISFNLGVRSSSVTNETLQEVAAFLDFSTDNFSSVLTGNANKFGTAYRLVDDSSNGDEEGSHVIRAQFLYKATASGTKVRLQVYVNTEGGTNYTVETVAGDMIAGDASGQGFDAHNITSFTVVRIA